MAGTGGPVAGGATGRTGRGECGRPTAALLFHVERLMQPGPGPWSLAGSNGRIADGGWCRGRSLVRPGGRRGGLPSRCRPSASTAPGSRPGARAASVGVISTAAGAAWSRMAQLAATTDRWSIEGIRRLDAACGVGPARAIGRRPGSPGRVPSNTVGGSPRGGLTVPVRRCPWSGWRSRLGSHAATRAPSGCASRGTATARRRPGGHGRHRRSGGDPRGAPYPPSGPAG